MITRVKQTNWKSGTQKLIEISEDSDKAWVCYLERLTSEQLEDLAEAAVEAAHALRLIAETKQEADA